MKTKKLSKLLILFLSILCFSLNASAQNQNDSVLIKNRAKMTITKMETKVSLTKEQKRQLKDLVYKRTELKAQMRRLDSKNDEYKSIMEDYLAVKEQIDQVMTDDQLEVLKEKSRKKPGDKTNQQKNNSNTK